MYRHLEGRPGGLQARYEQAVANCVWELKGLSLMGVAAGMVTSDAADAWNGATGQAIHEAALGLPASVSRVRVGTGLDGVPLAGSQGWRTTVFNQDITGVLVALRTMRTDFMGSIDTPAYRNARALTLAGPALVAALGSHHLAPAVLASGLRSMTTSALSGLANAMRARVNGTMLPVKVQTELVKAGKLDRVRPMPGQEDLTDLETLEVDQARGTYWQRFRANFRDALPVVGDIKGELDARKPVTVNGEVVHETSRMKKFATGLRGANALTTVVGAGLTLQDERGRELAEVRRENPHLSADEAQQEAEKRAWAQTAGNVGSTAIASAAAGAAVGSAIPVAGTAIGFGVGLAAGFLMNGQWFEDADGDGEKDSVAERIGDATEALVRDPGKAAADLGNGIKDGAKNVASTVAGWFGG